MPEETEKIRAARRQGVIGKILMALGAGAILQSCHTEALKREASEPPAAAAKAEAARGGAFTGAVPDLEPGFVADPGGLLDAAARTALTNEIAALEAATGGGQMGVALFTTLSGIPVEDAALRIARTWQLGREGVDDGALLLVATEDREMRLEVGLGWEGVIPDSVAGDILREISPELKAGNWGEAAQDAVRRVRAAALGEPAPPRRRGNGDGGSSFPALPLGLFSLFVGFAMWDNSRNAGKKPRGTGAGAPDAPFPPSAPHLGGGAFRGGGGGRFGGGGASGRF